MPVSNQSSLALLQSVLHASQNGVLVYKGVRNADGALIDLQLTMVNAAAEHNLDRPAVEAVGQTFKHVHPHLAGMGLDERYLQVIETGQSDRFEFKLDRPGKLLPVWCDISAVRLEENSVLVSCNDITQAKADAARLSDLLQHTFNESINGITVFETMYDEPGEIIDFRFVMINDEGVRIGGYQREQLLGRTLWEIYPATKINGLFDDYVRVCKTGEPIAKEHYYPEYDIWREVKIVRVPGGVMVSYKDITALKKTEETARQQIQLLTRVLGGVSVGIAVLDVVRNSGDAGNHPPEFRFVLINALLEAILGRSAEQVAGKTLTDVFVDANESGLLSRCITGSEVGVVQELELPITLGKQAGWYRVSISPQAGQLILTMSEITQLKRAQLAHHRQIELLNSVLNSSQNLIIALAAIRDTTGRIVDFRYELQNEAHRRRIGQSDYQLLGQTMLGLFPKAYQLLDRYADVVITGQPFRTQIESDFGNGTGLYDLSAVKRDDGIVLTIQDVSPHKLAEQRLQDQVKLLKTISDNTPAGLVLWEAVRDDSPQRKVIDFRYRMTNLMNTYVTGHPAESLIGRDLLALFPRFRGTELETALRETLETGRTQRMIFTYYRETPGGWFDAQFIRINDGSSADTVLMTYMDVTEAHQAQLAQKQQSDLIRLLVDAQPAGIALYEPLRAATTDGTPGKIIDFTYSLTNEAGRRLSGRTERELMGRKMRELYSSEAAQELFDQLVEVAETGQPKEWLLPYFSDGIRGWFQSSLMRHGNQVLFTFLDVTDLKQQQQALEITNNELRRSNENLQKFAYVASHDLQEPLRKIRSFGDVLATTYSHVLDSTGHDIVSRMQGAAQRMSELIQHLLTYSRLSTKLIERKPIPLTELLSQTLDDLSVAIKESNATVDLVALPVIEGDKGQLYQLFQNLLSNAIKYRHPGVAPRVQVTCQTVVWADLPASVTLTPVASAQTGNRPDYYRINVADNAIGFDEKYLDLIFQVFQRLHGRDVYPGTGIGLAICQKVVENHQGALTATSSLGQGAIFSVYLPVSEVN